MSRFGAKIPRSATFGTRGRGGSCGSGARKVAASGEKLLLHWRVAGPSALSSDGPRGGSGAGRRQPAPGSPRRGGGEVPEALPRLLGGVSWWSVLPRGSSPSGPPPPPAVPLPGPQDPSARVRGAWGLRGFGNPGVARQGERPQLGLSQAAASSLGRAGSISRG